MGQNEFDFMPLTTAQCGAFNNFLGSRPYPWDKVIARDRKPAQYIYTGMYKTSKWPLFKETTQLHEKVYVGRPNDPGMWQQFVADPCVGTPCDMTPQVISHGVDQLRYDLFQREYNSIPFCLDQLNTVDEGIAKMEAVFAGYKKLPEIISSDFLRLLILRRCGTAATQSGLWLAGLSDAYGNPQSLDISDQMFTVSNGTAPAYTNNSLMINLNQNGGLTALVTAGALTAPTTDGLIASMGQLTMEYLVNAQADLAANGYHDEEWLPEGKFTITMDSDTGRALTAANPALTGLYKASDFTKAGAFYSLGVTAGCGDWLFKRDDQQMRFRFRKDLDGQSLPGINGGPAVGGGTAVWIEQVWPFVNVNATFGLKPVFSPDWKNAPIRMYHCYNRDAREVFVGDIASVNSSMKFGLSRSFMGQWKWMSPEYFTYIDPNTGVQCAVNNYKKNRGFWMGEFRYGIKTVYPEIERVILAVGQAQPYIRKPNTGTVPVGPTSNTDYQSLLAYSAQCYDPGAQGPGWNYPPED
jgi:hypothetical protein